jgi:hypothetical protein
VEKGVSFKNAKQWRGLKTKKIRKAKDIPAARLNRLVG